MAEEQRKNELPNDSDNSSEKINQSPIRKKRLTSQQLSSTGCCGPVIPLMDKHAAHSATPTDPDSRRRAELDKELSQKPVLKYKRSTGPGSVKWEWDADHVERDPVLDKVRLMTSPKQMSHMERVQQASKRINSSAQSSTTPRSTEEYESRKRTTDHKHPPDYLEPGTSIPSPARSSTSKLGKRKGSYYVRDKKSF